MRTKTRRVLVCGGRDFIDRDAVWRELDALAEVSADVPLGRVLLTVIHGDCETGADALADAWAITRWADPDRYPADWTDLSHPDAVIRKRADGTRYDAKAGPRRNQRMIDVGRPEVFIAFPRADGRFGPGTSDMIRRAEAARIPRIPYRVLRDAGSFLL